MLNIMKGPTFLMAFALLMIQPALSYADRHEHRQYHEHHDHDGHSRFSFGISVFPERYYYEPYYYEGPVLVSPAVVSTVSSFQPVSINGVTYYVNNGTYYMYDGYGYRVVTLPVTVVQPAPVVTTVPVDSQDVFTVNIPNDKGGYTAVTVNRSGKGFVGPQGEYYPEFPTVSQLKAMYGRTK